MKRLIILALGALTFLFSGPVMAQEFDGFAMNAPKTETIDMCYQHGGVWMDMPRRLVPDEPSGLTSGGTCLLEQVVALAKDGSYNLITAGKVTFVFDYNQRVEFAIFDFSFPTWSQRDHARKSVKAHANEIFPLTVTRLDPNKDAEYKMNNLPYFFTLLESEGPETAQSPKTGHVTPTYVYHLALAISRRRITSYETTAGVGIREVPEVDLDVDLNSTDPLKGLDED